MASPEITLDEAGHVYRFGGHVVPSVTQVLSILNDFSDVDPELLERSAEFGRNVHAAIDLDNRGALDEAALDPEITPYLAQWRLFVRESGLTIVQSEARVFHPALHYAGTVDVVGFVREEPWVIDVKTGSIPRSVGAQLEGYRQALGLKKARRMCVKLTADGYRLKECKGASDFSLFQSCLNIWRFKHAA
jgi:hypothetical protein